MRAALATGLPVFGTWISIADPLAGEVIGRAGYDVAILDAQHGGINSANVLPMIQALGLGGTAALVRVGWNDPMQIMRAVDLGALGVIVPMVSTAEQARSAAQAIRYPPEGVRSFGPVRTYHTPGDVEVAPLCLVMIETAEGMENLDAIASTPGVDGLFLGPVDLALSLGLGRSVEMSDQVFAAVDEMVAVCRRHGLISASAAMGVPNATALVGRGVQFVAQGSDLGFIRRGAASELQELHGLRARLGGGP